MRAAPARRRRPCALASRCWKPASPASAPKVPISAAGWPRRWCARAHRSKPWPNGCGPASGSARGPSGHSMAPCCASADLARLLPAGCPPLTALALVLPALAAADPLRYDGEPAAVMARARRLIPRLAAAVALSLDPRRLPAALDTGDPGASLGPGAGRPDPAEAAGSVAKRADPLRRSRTQCLDLCRARGRFHRRRSARVPRRRAGGLERPASRWGQRAGGAPVHEAGEPARAAQTVGDRLRRGEKLPGFGHPLYPEGDPRLPPLMDGALAFKPRSPRLRTLQALADAVQGTGRPRPQHRCGADCRLCRARLAFRHGPRSLPLGASRVGWPMCWSSSSPHRSSGPGRAMWVRGGWLEHGAARALGGRGAWPRLECARPAAAGRFSNLRTFDPMATAKKVISRPRKEGSRTGQEGRQGAEARCSGQGPHGRQAHQDRAQQDGPGGTSGRNGGGGGQGSEWL